MVIYKDINVTIKEKGLHAVYKNGKYTIKNGFALFNGDVPVAHWNDVTKQMEAVDNNRGRAYAARNRLQYRNKLKYKRK